LPGVRFTPSTFRAVRRLNCYAELIREISDAGKAERQAGYAAVAPIEMGPGSRAED